MKKKVSYLLAAGVLAMAAQPSTAGQPSVAQAMSAVRDFAASQCSSEFTSVTSLANEGHTALDAAVFGAAEKGDWHNEWPMSGVTLEATGFLVMLTDYSAESLKLMDLMRNGATQPDEERLKNGRALAQRVAAKAALARCLMPSAEEVPELPQRKGFGPEAVRKVLADLECKHWFGAGDRLVEVANSEAAPSNWAGSVDPILQDTVGRCEREN
ncbi:hypothetical protein N6L27_04315 [Leisingera sp. SS27]|uniref:hypothetical protein n=1 Tax=Leisingera sp. SS27 TaxID=2979462 RepID=UPI00232F3F13|nr:hypothetical protein [Leisingera sp. SS27]MDC0657215.1 hypothetical protein [Leisingera sp. SS27]